MKNTNQNSRMGRAVAAGLGVALVAGASLVAAAPAQAWNAINVYANEIAPNADSYVGWHQGIDGGIATVTTEGLELSGSSQIIYGFETPAGIDELASASYGNASWTTTADSDPAQFQIPVSFGPDAALTTLSPASPVSGANGVSGAEEWVTSAPLGGYAANESATLEEFIAELTAQGDVRVLGFGVLTEAGQTSVVTGISWLGDDYTFHQDWIEGAVVTVAGDYTVGATLTLTTSGWPEGTELGYQWGWGTGAMGSEIEGATGTSYTISSDMVGRYVSVIVTGTLAGYSETWISSFVDVRVTALEQPAAPAPVASSADLAGFLAAAGVAPLPASEVGLPAGELNPGTAQTATVPWEAGDSFVDVYMYSTPVLVGSFPVVDGSVQITLSPALLQQLEAGAHTLVITGQSSGEVKAVSLTLAATLAATGADVVGPITAAALLFMLGAALVVVRRRQALRA